MKLNNFFDKLGWLIEGLIPVLISFSFYFFFETLSFFQTIGFAGSISFAQLITNFVKNGNNLNFLKRFDYIIRLIVLILAIFFYLYHLQFYLFFWSLSLITLAILLSKTLILGRLKISCFMIFGRLMNYLYIYSIFVDSSYLRFLKILNGFII